MMNHHPVTPVATMHSARTPAQTASVLLLLLLVQGIYLVADDADAADAWVDALVLCRHLVATRCADSLEESLAPAPPRRSKHSTAVPG